jgi:hypothetical protein
MSQISCQNQISLAPLALAPPARLICLSHVFSRRLRCEQACSTPVRHISGPLAISAIMRTLCASLCVEPSCSRQHPCSTGSWDLGIPIHSGSSAHFGSLPSFTLSGADGSPSPQKDCCPAPTFHRAVQAEKRSASARRPQECTRRRF